ncbi:MAG: helix-turn-helix domain-containing protein [Gemmatimonadota bacterium]
MMSPRVYQADGPWGKWTFVDWSPACLVGIVERLWYFRGRTALPRERVMPNGLLELIVHLGPRFSLVTADRVAPCAEVGISGIQTCPMIVQAPAESCVVVGVQFTPAGAYGVLRQPLDDLTGLDVDLGPLLGSAATALAEACHKAPTADACLDAARLWILDRLRTQHRLDEPVAWIADRIRRRHGDVSIEALRARVGLTKSRLASTFREQIGVTPKLYARIHRFRHAVTRLREPSASLSALAVESGFYDQSHLTTEFRELSGLTPGEYLTSIKYSTGNNVAER